MLPTLSQSIRLSTPRDGVKSSFDCRTISHSLPSPTTMRRLGYEARTGCSSSNPKEWTPIPSACAAGERSIWQHPPSHSIDCEAFSRKRQPLHTRSRKHNETDHPSIPLFSSSLSLYPLPLLFPFLLQTPIRPNAPLRVMAETLHPTSHSNPDLPPAPPSPSQTQPVILSLYPVTGVSQERNRSVVCSRIPPKSGM